MKKRNIIKRNSGFLIGCVLAGGASFFAADVVLSDMLPNMITERDTEESQSGQTAELEPEQTVKSVYETDPFTITASGSVIKGVESEPPEESEKQSEAASENNSDGQSGEGSTYPGGEGDSGESGDGTGESGSDGWSGDGQSGSSDGWSDGSGSGDGGYSDGNYYEQPSDNGDGNYSDNSWSDGNGSDGNSGGNQGGTDTAWTPDDVILWGISSRYIDESELYNYDLGQLRLIRNEIFALHGRIFNSQDLMDYFSQKSWYVPTYAPEDFDANMFDYLNDYEEANLNVILNYEAALQGN
ncbi:MAG: YARHG domain-containing protein [Lachnospiraceae bacterium]|nr:YARHG domain-containing protein [Lachnospiraceae bacterium]